MVRLTQGNFEDIEKYTISPTDVAKRYQDGGAKILHIVDLDGAKNGKIMQLKTIKEIRKNFTGIIQVGGGVRAIDDVALLIKNKIDRVVIGSLAVKNIKLTQEIFKKFGCEKIVLALDFKMVDDIPYLATNGWTKTSNISLYDLIKNYPDLKYVLATDISKDGMQVGLNTKFYKTLTTTYNNINFIASGGVSSYDDITTLNKYHVYGAVIGKALYENKIKLEKAIALC